jgi:glycosyltransferase involved in cell wall biosynthesis
MSVVAAPSLAVILPVRDGIRTIAGAIDSVLSQVPPGTEIIVVVAEPDDGSAAIAAGHPGVQVLRQTGLGLAAARNQGIQASDAEIIGFCDADDCWAEGGRAGLLAHIVADPGREIVVGQVVLEALAGEPVRPGQQRRLGQTLPGFTPGALLVRRRVFDQVGWFDESLSIAADSDWLVRAAQAEVSMAIVPEIVLRKRLRAGSLSTGVERYRAELLQVARRYLARRRGGLA